MKIYSKIFANLYDTVIASLEKNVLSKKREFLLNDIQSPILEIGMGTGANIPIYLKHQNLQLTVVEISPFMIQRFQKKFSTLPFDINIYIDSIENKELLKKLPKFMSIVSTLTLCSVKNINQVLSNLWNLLEDKGNLYVIEHIRSPKTFYGKFQDVIYPCWRFIGDGCHINRKTDVLLKQFFFPLYEEYFFAGVDFYIAKMKKI